MTIQIYKKFSMQARSSKINSSTESPTALLTLLSVLLLMLCWLVQCGCSPPPTAPPMNSSQTPAAEESEAEESEAEKSEAEEFATATESRVIATSTQQNANPDWALFRGDTASSGIAGCSLPEELDVVWEYKVPSGAFEGTATIVTDPQNSRRQLALIADLDGKLYAFDLATGELQWTFAVELGFGTTPAFADGKIYLGDLDGEFFCLNIAGEKLWSFSAEGEINSSANFYQDKVLFGSQDAYFYALNRDTGELIWKYESQDQIRCSITVAEGRAFVAGCDGFLHIVNLQDGSAEGKVEIFAPTGSTPASKGKIVYFGNQSGTFFAVDVAQAKTIWTFASERDGNSFNGAAAVNDQSVIFGSRDRVVYSLKPETGELNWEVTLKAKVDASPVIVGQSVYVPTMDGRLYRLALADGSIEWQRQMAGGFISSPAVAHNRLVIATNRGNIYCLGASQAAAD